MKNFLKRMPRKGLLAVVTLVATFSTVALVQAWGPERPTYTIENPAPRVTFNSITNNPNYGDERTFFDAKDATNTSVGGFQDNVQVVDGQELLLRVYVHNNAADNLNTVPDGQGGFVGVARDTKVRIFLPTAIDGALRANAYISASNATPTSVYDTVDFSGAGKFGIEYVPGSARAYTNSVPAGMTLSDSIVTTGAPIGYTAPNGTVPGCFEYTSIVTIKVKVKKPSIAIEKTVRKLGGDKTWVDSLNVQPNDTVEYRLKITNTGKTDLTNITVGDRLPPNMSYLAGTTRLYNAATPAEGTKLNDGIVPGALKLNATYQPNSMAVIVFQAKVNASITDKECGSPRLRNVADVRADQAPTPVEDSADVVVNTGKDCKPTDKPSYVCESLTVDKIGGRKVRATVKAPVSGNAKVKTVTFNYGDGSTPKVTTNLVDEYEYKADGSFKITATINFTVDGADKIVTSDNCSKMVTFSTTTTLPNTGAGSMIGLFALVTVAGAIAHNVLSRRSVR